MGQHKHNPTAIAAKDGKLPPKPKNMSRAEMRREIEGAFWGALAKTNPELAAFTAAMHFTHGYGGKL